MVFGADMDNQHRVRHISVDNVSDLQLLRGSKYVQSAMDDTFLQVRSNLQKGRWCYFSGTGCQVAGLRAFLRKEYETLVTTDIVCHGVPSQWLYDQHISYIEKKHNGKVIDYYFRNNEKGSGGEIIMLKTQNGKIKKVYNPTYNLSPFLYSFMYGMTSRWSCYDCKFAKIPRQGDITLADYWGVKDYFPDIDNSKGVSLCLINTNQGKEVWNAIKGQCDYWASNIADASKENGNLIQSSKPHYYRSFIYKKIKKDGYSAVAINEFRPQNYHKILISSWISESSLLGACVQWISRMKHKIIE